MMDETTPTLDEISKLTATSLIPGLPVKLFSVSFVINQEIQPIEIRRLFAELIAADITDMDEQAINIHGVWVSGPHADMDITQLIPMFRYEAIVAYS